MSLSINDLFFFDNNVYAKLLRKETISVPEATEFFDTVLKRERGCEFFLDFFDEEVTPNIIRANMNFFEVIFDTKYRFELHGLLNEKIIYNLSCEKIKLICDFKHVSPKLSSITRVFVYPNKFKLMFNKWWTDSESIREIQLRLKLFFISDIDNPAYIDINSFVRKYRYDTIITKKLFFDDMMEENLRRNRVLKKSQRDDIPERSFKKRNTVDTLVDEFENLKL